MIKKILLVSIITLTIILGVVFAPTAQAHETNGATIAALQAQIQALTAQLNNTGFPTAIVFTRDLKVGSDGKDVIELQKILKIKVLTGYFGPATESALKLYQQVNGLPVTGVVDAATRAKLNNPFSGFPTQPSITILSPKGYQNYIPGQAVVVRFATNLPIGTPYKILLSGKGYKETLESSEVFDKDIQNVSVKIPSNVSSGDGTFNFIISTDQVKGGLLESLSYYFTIKQKNQPSITVLSPNGGETFKAGETIEIKYRGLDISDKLTAFLYSPTAGNVIQNTEVSTQKGIIKLHLKSSVAPGKYKINLCDENRSPEGLEGKSLCDLSDNYINVVSSSVVPRPTATLRASASQVVAGGTVTLTLSSTNATACYGAGFQGATSGSHVSPAITATRSFSVTCTGPGGTTDSIVNVTAVAGPMTATQATTQTQTPLTPPITPRPTATLRASASQVVAGGTVTLTLSSTNATSCYGANFEGATSGSHVSPAITATRSFSVSCTGPGGTADSVVYVTAVAGPVTATQATTQTPAPLAAPVTPKPTASLRASASQVVAGGTVTLTLVTTNATSCYGAGFQGQRLGTITSPAITSSRSFSVTCTGPGGTADSVVNVSVIPTPAPVTPKPTATLRASASQVVAGGTVTLTLSSTNATACYGAGFQGATSGSHVSPAITATRSFSVTCTGPGGTADSIVNVNVISPTSAIYSQSQIATAVVAVEKLVDDLINFAISLR